MPVVVDANITVALFIRLPYSDQADALFRHWRTQGTALHAPALWPAEVVSALRKMVAVGQIAEEDAGSALAALARMPIQVHLPDAKLLEASLVWAGRLGQPVAYDAQYMALAEDLGAELWTADESLFAAGEKLELPWVRWVGEEHGL